MCCRSEHSFIIFKNNFSLTHLKLLFWGLFLWNPISGHPFFLCLFIWLCQVLVAAYKIFSLLVVTCELLTAACRIWRIVPWPRIDPGPLPWELESLSPWAVQGSPPWLLFQGSFSCLCSNTWVIFSCLQDSLFLFKTELSDNILQQFWLVIFPSPHPSPN